MRIIVSLLDGNMRKGNVEDDTLIRDLAARLKLDPDCCLTLAGVSMSHTMSRTTQFFVNSSTFVYPADSAGG